MDRKEKLIGSIVLRIPNAKYLYGFFLSRVDLLLCEKKNILLCHFAKLILSIIENMGKKRRK